MARRGRPRHPDILTPREWEVLELLGEGLSNEQLAERLGITERTAKFHVSEILGKLGVSTREQAAAWNRAERRPRWMAPLSGPLKWSTLAKIAGVATLAATAAGLAILAWAVLETRGPDTMSGEYRTQNSATYGAIQLHLTIDKAVYSETEPVRLTLTATNTGETPITLSYSNELRYEFIVHRYADALLRQQTACGLGCAPQWVSSADWPPEQTEAQVTLLPRQTVTYSENWHQTGFDINQPVARGTYSGSASLIGCLVRDALVCLEPLNAHFDVGPAVFELIP